jgi:NDP-sugar pyrophosphorylase family protein
MTLAAGFKADVLKDYLEKRGYYSWINPWMDIQLVEEKEPLDTCGAIINTLGISAGPHSEPFLVINGDSLILPNGEDNYEELYYDGPFRSSCTIFTCKKEHNGCYGNLIREPGGWIEGFENGVAGLSYINCGYYIFRREFFDRYRDPKDKQRYIAEKLSLEKDVFPQRIEEGDSFMPIIIDKDHFLEVGTPEALEGAKKILMEF